MKKSMNIQLMILALALCTTRSHAAGEDSHEGHAHAAVEDAGSENTQRVAVTQEQVARLGIKVSQARRGTVRQEIRVPGEIKVNTDQMAHVVPLVPGVVLNVSAKLGQHVKEGQVLAVINSRELAEAKAAYLALVERLQLTQENYDREERLREKKVSPEQDFLAARQALAEAKILEKSARQKLAIFGVDPSTLPELGAQADEEFALYPVVSPLDGVVIGKQIVRGEVIDEQAEVFVIADLSSVWVDLAISQDAVADVVAGQSVMVKLSDEVQPEAKIEFVAPIVDADSRTVLARATMSNPAGQFRPGTFVDARILVPSAAEEVVIPKSSIQLVNDHSCVFVWGNADFELREVITGVTDGQQIEILKGVRAGELVASENAFHLKAELAKSPDAGCGGHGHAH